MTVTRSVLFLIIAGICFAAALVTDLSVIHSNARAWEDGGLLSLVLSMVP